MNDPRHARECECGWQGHADAQARRMAALSLAEKLDWLEQAHAMLRCMQAARPPAGGESAGDTRAERA